MVEHKTVQGITMMAKIEMHASERSCRRAYFPEFIFAESTDELITESNVQKHLLNATSQSSPFQILTAS